VPYYVMPCHVSPLHTLVYVVTTTYTFRCFFVTCFTVLYTLIVNILTGCH